MKQSHVECEVSSETPIHDMTIQPERPVTERGHEHTDCIREGQKTMKQSYIDLYRS
jgi:hypothetical protein